MLAPGLEDEGKIIPNCSRANIQSKYFQKHVQCDRQVLLTAVKWLWSVFAMERLKMSHESNIVGMECWIVGACVCVRNTQVEKEKGATGICFWLLCYSLYCVHRDVSAKYVVFFSLPVIGDGQALFALESLGARMPWPAWPACPNRGPCALQNSYWNII